VVKRCRLGLKMLQSNCKFIFRSLHEGVECCRLGYEMLQTDNFHHIYIPTAHVGMIEREKCWGLDLIEHETSPPKTVH